MSFPTILGPWYVVQRLFRDPHSSNPDGVVPEYYTAREDDAVAIFQKDPKRAMLFMSLASAARVALAEGAEVRVLTSKEEAQEFGRA